MGVGGVSCTVGFMMPYEKLDAWKAAHRLALDVYLVSDRWPRREIYGLTAQARRAAVSMCANIAEGSAKRGNPEFGRYLDMALGSFSELSYILRLALELGLLSLEDEEYLTPTRDRAGKLLWGLYRSTRPSPPTKRRA